MTMDDRWTGRRKKPARRRDGRATRRGGEEARQRGAHPERFAPAIVALLPSAAHDERCPRRAPVGGATGCCRIVTLSTRGTGAATGRQRGGNGAATGRERAAGGLGRAGTGAEPGDNSTSVRRGPLSGGRRKESQAAAIADRGAPCPWPFASRCSCRASTCCAPECALETFIGTRCI